MVNHVTHRKVRAKSDRNESNSLNFCYLVHLFKISLVAMFGTIVFPLKLIINKYYQTSNVRYFKIY